MQILQLLTIVAMLGTSVHFGLAQDASTFGTLYSFTGQPDGSNPVAGVVIGRGGVLYGTTNSGGTSNQGTVFELRAPVSPGGTWTETVLHDFTGSDGANPYAAVVIGTGGVLYGTTAGGGTSGLGTVFALEPPASAGGAWTETVLLDFAGSNGANPYAAVLIGNGGVLYGTTAAGGETGPYPYCPGGCGEVFSLTPPASPGGAWTFTWLVPFFEGYRGCLPGGTEPHAPVVIGSGGALYGTTKYCGGQFGKGTVFPASQRGFTNEYPVHDFGSGTDGAYPEAGVVIGSGGVLYGTTSSGGTSNFGTVFSLAPPTSPGGAWTETVLYSFSGTSSGDGSSPAAPVVIGIGGALYGTTKSGGTSNYGSVFKLTPPASPGGPWTETVLHSFTGGRDGAAPLAGLAIGKNGILYGATSKGGASHAGTVFALKP